MAESIIIEKMNCIASEKSVKVPSSKSILARAVVLAAMSEGKTVLSNVTLCEDTRTMISAFRDLGVSLFYKESTRSLKVYGCGGILPKKEASIYVGSAGTAARFLVAMLGFQDGTYLVNASEQMKKRPMKGLTDALVQYGAKIEFLENEDCLPLRITGHREAGESPVKLEVEAFSSTQFASGLMMSLACLPNRSMLILKNKSRDSYIKMTCEMIKEFGGEVDYSDDRIFTTGKMLKRDKPLEIEADISAACYFLALGALQNKDISVEGFREKSIQGDAAFHKYIDMLMNGLEDITINLSDCSDQTATAAVLAAVRKGSTRIEGIEHINLQESKRISVICENLGRCGIDCEEGKDFCVIHGGSPSGAKIDPHGDHRIAMAFAILGTYTGNMEITDKKCVSKTFEGFFEELLKLYA